MIKFVTKLILAYLMLITLQGLIASINQNDISVADTTTDLSWREDVSFPVYRDTRIKGYIHTNFSVQVDIKVFDLEDNITKNVMQFNMTGRDKDERRSFEFKQNKGAWISMQFQSIEAGNGTKFLGIYFIEVDSIALNLFEGIIPYIIFLTIALALSLVRTKVQSLRTYVGKLEGTQSGVALSVVIFSLVLINPRVQLDLFSPEKTMVNLLMNPFYPLLWWGILAFLSVKQFTLSSVDVQNLWTYPDGKKLVFLWRMVFSLGYVWIIHLSVILSYLLIIYNSFIGYTLSWSIFSNLMIYLLVPFTKITQIFLVITLVNLLAGKMHLPLISILYLIFQNSGIAVIEIGEKVSWTQSMIQVLIIPFLIIIVFKIYMRSEVLS